MLGDNLQATNQAEPASLEGLGAGDLIIATSQSSDCFPYSFPLNLKQDSHKVNCPITGSHEFFINLYRSNLMSVTEYFAESSELLLHTLLFLLYMKELGHLVYLTQMLVVAYCLKNGLTFLG